MAPELGSGEGTPSLTGSKRGQRIQSNGYVATENDNTPKSLSSVLTKLDGIANNVMLVTKEADVESQFNAMNETLGKISSKVDELVELVQPFQDNDSGEMGSDQFENILQAIRELSGNIDKAAGSSNQEQSQSFDERLNQLQTAADALTAHINTQKNGGPAKDEAKTTEMPEKSEKSKRKKAFAVQINLWCKEGKRYIRGGHDLFTIDPSENLPTIETSLKRQFKALFKDKKDRSNLSAGAVYWTRYHKIVSIKAGFSSTSSGDGWNDEVNGPTGTTLTQKNHEQFFELVKNQTPPTMIVTIAPTSKNEDGKGKKGAKKTADKQGDDSDASEALTSDSGDESDE